MSHLMSVSALVLEHGGNEDQAIAALLHDAVEDAPAGEGPAVLAYIREHFGESVAAIVEACSDGLDESGNRSGSWPERKRPYVAGLLDPMKKSDEALLVTAADKIHNGSRIAADLREFGPTFWSTFNACEHELLWYYTSVEAAVAERLRGSSIATALRRAVDDLVAAAKADRQSISQGLPTCACRSRACLA
jgi:(p)ppGpp synthase/HD superfamily hydrolase